MIRLDSRVTIVTGAGGGLGRAHAPHDALEQSRLELAKAVHTTGDAQ